MTIDVMTSMGLRGVDARCDGGSEDEDSVVSLGDGGGGGNKLKYLFRHFGGGCRCTCYY